MAKKKDRDKQQRHHAEVQASPTVAGPDPATKDADRRLGVGLVVRVHRYGCAQIIYPCRRRFP